MELIILGLGGSIGAVLSQLLDFISQWRSATHRPLLNQHRAAFQGSTVLPAKAQAIAFRLRLRGSV